MLDIYRASAGSGKTFALTLEYFRIIFHSPVEYRNILAVTFTNKATEEMKSRIINELHRLAEGKESDYGNILRKELGYDDDQLRNRAILLRTMLLHDYGRLAITTIDRFFQRIVKSFTRELSIFPGYNVELDSEYVLLKAIDKIMQQLGERPELKAWVNELMNHNVDEGKSWSVKSRIAELGEELFRENYMLFDKQILEKFGDRRFLRNYQDFLDTIIENYEHRQQEIGRKGGELIRENGLELADFKGNKSGCASHFYKLADGNYDEPTQTICKGVDNPESWYTKTATKKNKIIALYPQLNDLLKESLQLFDHEYCRYLSASQLSGNLYQLGILNDLYQEVRTYCDEKGLMLLSDTTHLLNMLIAENDASFLFEKCGNYYKHLMIDEFQDTSALQWQNFRPLVVNSLSEGCHTLIVGDVKQSIYRWRNGEWGLLAYGVEKEFSHFGVEKRILDSNWRSAHEIVEFNNGFFDVSVRVLSAIYAADAGADDPRIKVICEAYQGLQQKPRKNKNGYVDITFGPEKREEDADKTIMEEVVATITDIIQRGGKQKDIVILVRGGKEGAFVAEYLMEYNKTAAMPVDFISNDSLYIWSSPYIQFIIAVLKYMVEPYDMVNKATILYFYNAFIRNEDQLALHRIFGAVHEDVFELLQTDFQVGTEGTLSYSLYETIEAIIDKFNLKEKCSEIPYLIAFQDVIYEYESGNSNSIALFLEWWEKEQGKRVLSTSEEVDAVRILTIHKSKGLEFEYVILPFCSWELDAVRPVRRIWCRNGQPGFDQLEYAPLNYSAKLAKTIFKEDYLDEHLKACIDNLNLLYVALTRAKTELYIRPYAPKMNKDGSIALSDIGAFIYEVLAEMQHQQATGEEHFHLGNKQVLERENHHVPFPLSLNAYPVWQPEGRISVKYNFRDYTEPENSGLSAIDEGKLLHEIFKQITHAGDIAQAVQYAYLSGLIRYEERDKYIAKIRKYLSHPQASEWFSPTCQVITEKDILFPGGEKVRPDRVILSGDKILIIDYKFGLSEEPKYIKQVRFYCSALERMGGINVIGYIWYVKTGKVVAVTN